MRADMCSDLKTHLKAGEVVPALGGIREYCIIEEPVLIQSGNLA